MSAILELPEARSLVAHLSVEEFHRGGEIGIYGKRAELLRGIVFEKPPGTPLHCKLSKRLYDSLLNLALPHLVILHQSPLTLRDSEPLPDVSVVPGRDSDFDARHPSTAELVIEVAVSSVALDRENAALFAEADVKEYWIVLGEKRQMEGGPFTLKTPVSTPKTTPKSSTIDTRRFSRPVCGRFPRRGCRVWSSERT